MYQILNTNVLLSESSESASFLPHYLVIRPTSYNLSLRREASFKGKLGTILLTVNLPNSKRARISLRLKIETKDWDKKKQRAKGASEMSKIINHMLDEARLKTMKILSDYQARSIVASPEMFTADYKNKSSSLSFLDFARKELEAERPQIAHSTYNKIKSSLNVLELFKANLAFSEINEETLIEYERFLKLRGNLPNARAKNLSQLRKYVNVAIRKKYLRENPFLTFKVKGGPSDRQALTPDQVSRLIELYFNENLHATLKEVLQYFLAAVFTGLRYQDIAQLKRSNIIERSLVLQPQKTLHLNKIIRVPLPEVFFNIIEPEGDLFKRVLTNQKTNERLKSIMVLAGIPTNLTFHIARHTFACLYLYFGGKLEELRVLMGHGDLKTTTIYVHITEAWTKRGMDRFDDYFKGHFTSLNK